MIIEQHAGQYALQWLEEAANIAAWTRLYNACPRATPYQSPLFARVWLKHYGDLWEPLLLVSRGVGEDLAGILPLARQGTLITGIGAHQAEYQTWLSSEPHAEAFIESALQTLFEAFHDACLRLRYVEPGATSTALRSLAESHNNIIVQDHARPLMALESEAIDAVLRKKSNRSKLNRLKRQGEFKLECGKLEADREAILDEIIELYDFRQGAVNDSCPFLDDPRKRAFHLDWLATAPDQLDVYRLSLDGRTIAALVGVTGRSRTSNAILAYSPHYARQSPGKIHLYLVAKSLADKGQSWLDLTPGGDPWKERFATHHDVVLELNAWANPAVARRLKRSRALMHAVSQLLKFTGVHPAKVKSWYHAARRFEPRSIAKLPRWLITRRYECRIYRLNLENRIRQPDDGQVLIRVDALADLTYFRPTGQAQSRHRFLESALDRIERGEKIYSVCVDGTLMHFGWLSTTRDTHYIEDIRQNYTCPDPGALLYDFYLHPQASDHEYCKRSITRMVDDLAMHPGAGFAYIVVPVDNSTFRNTVESLGFEYVDTLVRDHITVWSRYRKARPVITQ